MNSQLTMYRAEARQTELRSTAARSSPVSRTSTRSWAGRFRGAAVRWRRQPLAARRSNGRRADRATAIDNWRARRCVPALRCSRSGSDLGAEAIAA